MPKLPRSCSRDREAWNQENIARLQQEIAAKRVLEANIVNMNIEIDGLKTKVINVEAEVSRKDQQLHSFASLPGDMNQLQVEVVKGKTESARLQQHGEALAKLFNEERAKALDIHQKAKAELDGVTSKLKEEEAKYASLYQLATTHEANTNSKITELEKEKGKLTSEIQDLKRNLDTVTGERDDYHSRMAIIASGPPGATGHYTLTVEVQRKIEQAQRDTLIKTRDHITNVFKGQVDALQKENHDLKQQATTNLRTIEDLQQMINDAGGSSLRAETSLERAYDADWTEEPDSITALAATLGCELPKLGDTAGPARRACPPSGSQRQPPGSAQPREEVPPPPQPYREEGGEDEEEEQWGEDDEWWNEDEDDGQEEQGGEGEPTGVKANLDESNVNMASKIKTAIGHAKSYEKCNAPKFPRGGDTLNWMISMSTNLCMAGGYTDQDETAWLKECHIKSFEELADADSSLQTSGMKGDRARKADIMLHKTMVGLINSTQEPLKNDLVREERKAYKDDKALGGRQLVWMLLNYFKTNRSLVQRYTWEDIKEIKWRGDEHLFETYERYSLIMGDVQGVLPEDTQIETFLGIFKTSKKLAPDIHEFNRFDLDDSRRTLRFLTDSIERLMSRERMEAARATQKKRIAGGGLDGYTADQNALGAKAKGKGKGGKKGKGKGKGKDKDGKGKGDGKDGKLPPELMFCRTFARTGHCKGKDDGTCKYKHVSRTQLNKALGFDVMASDPNAGGGGGGGAGAGKGGKGKDGKGKKSKRGKSADGRAAPATAEEHAAVVKELNALKSKQIVCAAFQKGNCNKDGCGFAHVEPDVANEIARAKKVQQQQQKQKRSKSADGGPRR